MLSPRVSTSLSTRFRHHIEESFLKLKVAGREVMYMGLRVLDIEPVSVMARRAGLSYPGAIAIVRRGDVPGLVDRIGRLYVRGPDADQLVRKYRQRPDGRSRPKPGPVDLSGLETPDKPE
jgi:hypothetical protein